MFCFRTNGKAKQWRCFLMKMKQTKRKRFFARTFLTGFIGGIIWSVFAIGLYYFNFIEVHPKAYILRSWLVRDWTIGWRGTLVTIVLAGILSICISFAYYFLFKKLHSIWIGIGFGFLLWLVFALSTQYFFPDIKQLTLFNRLSIVSTLCTFILYGTFIGYAISYDYYETFTKKQEVTS